MRSWRESARSLQQWAFDRIHGTDTAGIVPVGTDALADASTDASHRYEATPRSTFRAMMDGLGDPTDFTFVDVGSGKGAVLLYASAYRFRRIVGIEVAPALHAIAAANIVAFGSRRQRCDDITSVCTDALAWDLPDEPMVVHLYNPFPPAVLGRFLERVRTSQSEHPRSLLIMARLPADDRQLDGQIWLKETTRGRTWTIHEAIQ